MKKLNRDQSEHVATLMTNYAGYKFANSNADDYFIVWHGEKVLAYLNLLGMPDGMPFSYDPVKHAVRAAQERLDYAEYKASQT